MDDRVERLHKRMNYVDRALLTGIAFLTILYIESVTIERLISGPMTRRYWNRIEGRR